MKLNLTTLLFILIIPVIGLTAELSVETTTQIDFQSPLPASFTSEQLFDRMEKKSETIEAIISEVELYDNICTSTVTLRVKSPDKFSITFSDGSSSIFFNGMNLWVYIKQLNECFYYYPDNLSMFDKWTFALSLFNPKKVFMDLTRNSLNALFEIKAVKREKKSDGDYHYYLRFTPKLKNIFILVFELGYYEAVFSEKIYLPVKVMEYDDNNCLRSILTVKSYKMNEDIQDKVFEFENTTNARLVPIGTVVRQKFEDYKDKLMEKLDNAANSVKRNLFNWGF